MSCRKIVLLRGVTPNGRSKIPSMIQLAQVLEESGFKRVKTYIQTGNLILETDLSDLKTKEKIESVIYDKIGADLSAVIKSHSQLRRACEENPFTDCKKEDKNYIKLIFTNDFVDKERLKNLVSEKSENEKIVSGSECIYVYSPKGTGKKLFSNNFIERTLRITATGRSLKTIEHLCSL